MYAGLILFDGWMCAGRLCAGLIFIRTQGRVPVHSYNTAGWTRCGVLQKMVLLGRTYFLQGTGDKSCFVQGTVRLSRPAGDSAAFLQGTVQPARLCFCPSPPPLARSRWFVQQTYNQHATSSKRARSVQLSCQCGPMSYYHNHTFPTCSLWPCSNAP